MTIYHKVDTPTTYQETTLLNQYNNRKPESTAIKEEKLVWFPDITTWSIEEIERLKGAITGRLASK